VAVSPFIRRVKVSHIGQFATVLVYLRSETSVRSYILHLCTWERHFTEDHTTLLLLIVLVST